MYGKFLATLKDNKATVLFSMILVTLRQQVFWEFASALRNVFTSWFRKLECQSLAFSKPWKHIIGIITK
jgi:hypothetical protein